MASKKNHGNIHGIEEDSEKHRRFENTEEKLRKALDAFDYFHDVSSSHELTKEGHEYVQDEPDYDVYDVYDENNEDSGGECEDDKARLITNLMKNHSDIVTASLVDRSNLIQSVVWLSRHVPRCVLKFLIDSLHDERKEFIEHDDIHVVNGHCQAGTNAKTTQEPEFPLSTYRPCSDKTTETETSTEDSNKVRKDLANLLKVESSTASSLNSLRNYNSANGELSLINKTELPITTAHKAALLFVDMSGFTKISTTLDVESLSDAINSYFEMIVNNITTYGGDILKFAGDAIFAEWRVDLSQKNTIDLEACVATAAICGANIVKTCSNFPIFAKKNQSSVMSRRGSSGGSANCSLNNSFAKGESEHSVLYETMTKPAKERRFQRRGSLSRIQSVTSMVAGTLNVKCGLGVGEMVGMHAGDNIFRREYLILGNPIDQVSNAECAAKLGEVFASPEALECLSKVCEIEGDWKSAVIERKPFCIAALDEHFFQYEQYGIGFDNDDLRGIDESGNVLRWCDDLDFTELEMLKKMISLYVHPVVVNDENEGSMQTKKRSSDHERHLAEAELRNVYVMFIMPLIEPNLTGDQKKDQHLFHLLNNVMNVTTRELGKMQGHLRQFIVDDKGVVLIGTFGLRGSTFPNMIAQRALPVTLSIHEALKDELGVESMVGGTFGRVYCGVVGGSKRHEYAALGPSVNLAARLMASKTNPGVLVDKNVRMLTSQIFFKPLPPVNAKGYDDPVPIFVPVQGNEPRWGNAKNNFVGRSNEIKQIMHIAKKIISERGASKFVFISATSGTGKSSMLVQATERVRAMMKMIKKRVIVTRNISNEGDTRVPFSLFRVIFKDLLLRAKLDDDNPLTGRRTSRGSMSLVDSSDEFSIDDHWDQLSIKSHSTNESTMSTEVTRFRYICKEMNASPEFIDIVGKKLLGLRDKSVDSVTANASSLNLKAIVDFMAGAFIRCTRNSDIILLALDDVQWMDEMSWKVVQAIFERGKNVLIICGSRPPSTNPLSVDSSFWASLQREYKDNHRFSEIDLNPFNILDVKEMIANSLDLKVTEVDCNFAQNVFNTSGGMPHFLSYMLDSIKRNNLTARLENGLVGLKSSTGKEKTEFESVNELLLYRLDSLDASVRSVLHLAAVMGTEFELLDAALAYEGVFCVKETEKLEAAMALRDSLDLAVQEGIIEELFVGGEENNNDEEVLEEDYDHGASLGDVYFALTGRKSHPLYADNRRYRFTHDSWRTSILSCMLHERRCDLHEHIAIALESYCADESEQENNIERQIRILKHWTSSGNFVRSANISLKIGGQLMLLGLNSQGIMLFDDSLSILKEQGMDSREESHGGICISILNTINVPELDRLIKLNVARGKAFSTLGMSKQSTISYQNALDILNNTICADSEDFDRSVSFPIFSGLFVVLKMGAIEQDEECTFEKHLISKFVEQARLNGDPVHYGRALAMQGETFGRLGNFEQAFQSLEKIKKIYNIKSHHAAICRAYGSDRVAQAFSHSVNWNRSLGRIDAALDTCNFIIETLLPHCDPKNVHNSFCLLYSCIVTMKDNGLAFDARRALLRFIVHPFDEHFGPGGSTFSKPLFQPILVLLDLQGNEFVEVDKIDEYTEWASDERNMPIQSESLENAWAAMAVSPSVLFGEIYYYLAKRQNKVHVRRRFIQIGISLMERTLTKTKSLPFARMYSTEKLENIKAFAKEL